MGILAKGKIMKKNVINKINKFNSFKFDEQNYKVVNLNTSDDTDIDEFLNIQFLLDCNRVMYYFKKNFEIQIIK